MSGSLTTQAIDENQRLDPPNARAVAEYIHDLSAELGLMAGSAQLPMLHYLLNMVRIEAEALLRQGEAASRPTRRRRM